MPTVANTPTASPDSDAFDRKVAETRKRAANLRAQGDEAEADDLEQFVDQLVAWVETS